MSATADVMSALAAHNARLVIEGDRVRLLFPPGHPPPTELIEAAREHRDSLRSLLTADRTPEVGRPFDGMLAALRSGCPELIESDRWQQAIQDADSFLEKWGQQAHALGWTARPVPGPDAPSAVLPAIVAP